MVGRTIGESQANARTCTVEDGHQVERVLPRHDLALLDTVLQARVHLVHLVPQTVTADGEVHALGAEAAKEAADVEVLRGEVHVGDLNDTLAADDSGRAWVRRAQGAACRGDRAVSYTHLTLPTILLV